MLHRQAILTGFLMHLYLHTRDLTMYSQASGSSLSSFFSASSTRRGTLVFLGGDELDDGLYV